MMTMTAYLIPKTASLKTLQKVVTSMVMALEITETRTLTVTVFQTEPMSSPMTLANPLTMIKTV